MKKILIMVAVMSMWLSAGALGNSYTLKSPNGRLVVFIDKLGDGMYYSVNLDMKTTITQFSRFGLIIDDTAFQPMTVKKATRRSVDETVASPFYRQATLRDHYNELTITLKEGYSVIFRAYDEGVAYRYQWQRAPGRVMNEIVEYRFDNKEDWPATVPYAMQFDSADHTVQWSTSFENQYITKPISQLDPRRLCFLPLMVHGPNGLKMCITESSLLDYPGLYLHGTGKPGEMVGEHATYPTKVEQGGWGNLQMVVKERADYIAEMNKEKLFPWRILMVAESDAELAMNNMSYLLAEPAKVYDLSWIKPGKAAWEWWNSWNIGGVDFEAGINNETYKHYIDFAARYGLQYIVMDEGWSVGNEADLFKVVPELDLPMLVNYANERGVGIILWAGHYAFERDMERVCQHYSEMGVKGFKIDFMNRDDQLAVQFFKRAAQTCAKHRLVVDFHGAFKPAGFTRTYPNVLNFEGVFGLEQMRWSGLDWDQMRYDCEIPFIRQTAGPMDYTPGAMLNGTRNTYRPNGMEPMSMGTRCHQLALYVVLDAPLAMLCDSPTNYDREPEYTRFLAEIPTVWDTTRVLQGEVGEYIVIARRKGSTWYIAGITNWTARDVDIALPVVDLNICNYSTIELYTDGANAHRRASDYSHKTGNNSMPAITIHMAPGGGFVAVVKQ